MQRFHVLVQFVGTAFVLLAEPLELLVKMLLEGARLPTVDEGDKLLKRNCSSASCELCENASRLPARLVS